MSIEDFFQIKKGERQADEAELRLPPLLPDDGSPECPRIAMEMQMGDGPCYRMRLTTEQATQVARSLAMLVAQARAERSGEN